MKRTFALVVLVGAGALALGFGLGSAVGQQATCLLYTSDAADE